MASGSTAGPLNVTVGEDQDIVCTIRNIRFGTVIVKKQTEPNGDTASFVFSGLVSGTLKDGQTLTKLVLPGTLHRAGSHPRRLGPADDPLR